MDVEFIEFNIRRGLILKFFNNNKEVSISQLLKYVNDYPGINTAKITLNRDLRELLELGWIIKVGQGRSTSYKLSLQYNLFRELDNNLYFKTESDKRSVKEKFDFGIFLLLEKASIFLADEIKLLKDLTKEYQKNIKNISPGILKKEFERLMIDLSWKSSKIEGNTYTLLETEVLIRENKKAKNRTDKETIMIINHKKAFEYILSSKDNFKKISIAKIENVHYLLTKELNISRNLRKTLVGITGTKYRPLDNEHQIREALEKTCKLVNKIKNPFSKALLLMILIAYIQPFEDGNKRTSRLLGNAILIANGICPLSYSNADEIEYKKAVILFYELNNIRHFKMLFIAQFMFAIRHYFRIKM